MEPEEQSPYLDILIKRFEEVAHCRELGFEVVGIEPGEAVMRVDYQDRLVADAGSGIIHGGGVTTLLDTVCGPSVMSAIRARRPVATLDLRIDYLKPAAPGEAILAFAECYKITRHIAFVSGIACHHDRDDPIAHCASTYMVQGTGKG